MSHPRDVTWLQIAGKENLSLHFHRKLDHITGDLPSAWDQYPRLIHFIGRRHKHLALRCLFPSNNFGRWRKQCLASLRVEVTSLASKNPLYISDSDTTGHFEVEPRYHYNNESEKLPLLWTSSNALEMDVNDTLQARLILPFADVLCLFVDDFTNLQTFAYRLLNIASRSSTFSKVRPRAYLVTSQITSEADFMNVMTAEQILTLQKAFSAVEVFHLASEALSPTARHRRLREVIIQRSMKQLRLRRQEHWYLSAEHFSMLFKSSAYHFAQTVEKPFEPVKVARILAQSSIMTPHVTDFIRSAGKLSVPRQAIVDLVSTAFFLDAYPAKMHAFDPLTMYKYYEEQLLDEVSFDLKVDLAFAFNDLFHAWRGGIKPLQLRKDSLRRHTTHLTTFFSNNSCLFCLGQSPEHRLPCQHSICDNCVRLFAQPLPDVEQRFSLSCCHLCGSNEAREILLKPPTAGVRIIAIDGGGARGAVSIESLCVIQGLLGELPLRDCFELALGTSSGGLIALAIFALHWSPNQCSEAFDSLSRKIFEPKRRDNSVFTSFKKYLRYWVSDGVYDHLSLEKHLQSIYGRSTWLFGAPSKFASSSKCAVTTSTITDGTPCLVTSYNGDRTRNTQGYELLRPNDTENEPLIWQAARATSAAPMLFQSFTMTDLGAFQDGGLKHNNPSRIACWESRRIWPEIQSPDLFLSLGTGAPMRDHQKIPQFRNFLLDGFVPRLFRSCMAKADGEIMWDEFVNSLDEQAKAQYYRLNIPLQGVALIDDVDSMDSLRESVRSQPDSTRISIVQSLLASCFFFQLERPVQQNNGTYHVRGSIRCRVNPTKLTEAMVTAGLNNADFATDFETISQGGCSTQDICQKCGRFRKNVAFSLRNLQESLTIYLRSTSQQKLKISGFPQRMDWFETQQGYSTVFGRNPDASLQCAACSGIKRGPQMCFTNNERSKKPRVDETYR